MRQYQLKRSSQSRNLRLKLNRDGEIVVTAPRLIPKLLIDVFVKRHEGWIEDKLRQIIAKKRKEEDEMRIFGHKYKLSFEYKANLPSGWQVVGSKLIYNSSRYLLKPKISPRLTKIEKQKLEQFAKATISAYLIKRVPRLHERMGIRKKLGRICVRNQTSRWGSCSSLGNLNFNYNLIHHPPAIIDYVIIHELAHLVYLDHSRKFWALVAKFDGKYREHKLILNGEM
jgi:predicted metal-dependent hydrolase